MLSESQGYELSDFPIILLLRHNVTGIQRSQCMRSVILRMLLEQR